MNDINYKTFIRRISPNPFRFSTEFKFGLEKNMIVSIGVYDLVGNKVKTLVNNQHPAGIHIISWDGLNDSGHEVLNGSYILKMSTDSFSHTADLIKLK
jgi:flagellar hook assembly protein FlgD